MRASASSPHPSTTVVPDRAEESEAAARQLREAGISGVLTYSDEDCRLHAVSLPNLEPVEAPAFEMCRPAISNGGLGVADGDVVWSGLGYRVAQVVLTSEELSRAILGARGAAAAGGSAPCRPCRWTAGACSCSRTPAPGWGSAWSRPSTALARRSRI